MRINLLSFFLQCIEQCRNYKNNPNKQTAESAIVFTFCFSQGMYVFLHAVKGTPFETPDQGKARLLTHWEQLDYGVQFTSSRKFFTISPIIL